MDAFLTAAPAAAIHARETPAALAAIAEPGVAVAIWRRRLDPTLAAWLDALPPARLPALRATLAPGAVADAVRAACAASGCDGIGAVRLSADAGVLAAALAQVAGVASLRLRLEVVTGDKCRRFHLDAVRCRLLCTYRGAGTEFGEGRGDADPDPLRRLGRGEAAAFRGARWPGEPTAIVHRSPPIAGTGETRLLLVIDPADHDDDCC